MRTGSLELGVSFNPRGWRLHSNWKLLKRQWTVRIRCWSSRVITHHHFFNALGYGRCLNCAKDQTIEELPLLGESADTFFFLKHPDGVRNLQESGREQGWGYGQSLKSADFVRWSRRVSVSSNGWFLKLGYLPQTLDKCGQNNSKSNHVWWFIAPIYGPLRDGVFLLLFFSHIIRYDLTCMHQDAHSALAAFRVVRCVPGVFSHYQGRLVIHLIYTSR